jgi:hypothetical protein
MFVGHYGVSFWARTAEPRLPLWAWFIAVAALDFLWSPLVLLNIENVLIIPPPLKLDLYYMPYSHSLAAAAIWTVLAALAIRIFLRRASWKLTAIVAGAVLSHWFLDLVVHTRDLPLYDNAAKVGLGLWNFPLPALFVEAALVCGGVALYLSSGVGTRRSRTAILMCVILVVHATLVFGPSPATGKMAAALALALNGAFVVGAVIVERPARTAVTSTATGESV